MMKAYLIRTYLPDCTIGVFVAQTPGGNVLMECSMLELPWRDNQRKISCIPEGVYRVRIRRTDKFGQHYHILDVPNRDSILQHSGNFTTDILGCQLPGSTIIDLNKDLTPDIRDSKVTLKKMISLLGAEYTLIVGSFEPPKHDHQVNPSQYWADKHAAFVPVHQLPTA
jgi:hypothetical protein